MLLHHWYQSPAPFCPPGGVIVPGAPVNVEAPDNSGTGVEGTNLFCDEGLWDGSEPIAFEYQWYYREPDEPTEPTAPSNNTAPFLTGSAYVDTTLHSSSGTWFGSTPITYHYQWKRNGVNAGTDSANYPVLIGDMGATFSCTVTAVNSVGSVSANSSNTKGPITEAPPAEVLTTGGTALTAGGEDLTVIPS